MERLAISDPKIEEQLRFRLAQLNEFYPDKVITRLDADHKKLGEKLSALYKQIGYASRGDLLSAYGFTIGSKQGRPSSVDPAEIFIELRKRYAEKELPKTASILMEQNPDLAGQLKTLSNQSKELFGDTFKNVLIEERLLQGKVKARGGANQGPVQAMLDELVEIYGNGNAMYKSVTALKKAHPEFADEFDALQAHSKEWYGTTPVKLLKKLGVLGAGIVDQTAEDIDTLIEFFVSKYSNLPDDEKPKTFASLKTSWPDKEAVLIAGQHEWGKSHNESFVDMLRRRGVLQVSKKSIAEETKRLKARSVRNATIDELVDVLRQSGCPSVLEFDENRSVLLPERVLGIDLANHVELRESVFCGIVQNADDLQVGDSVKPQLNAHVR